MSARGIGILKEYSHIFFIEPEFTLEDILRLKGKVYSTFVNFHYIKWKTPLIEN
jgi:hypothetical protein